MYLSVHIKDNILLLHESIRLFKSDWLHSKQDKLGIIQRVVKDILSENQKIDEENINKIKNISVKLKTFANSENDDLFNDIIKQNDQDIKPLIPPEAILHQLEVAKREAEFSPRFTSEIITSFGISDEEMLFEIAKVAAMNNGLHVKGHNMAEYIHCYGFKDKNKLFQIAKILALNPNSSCNGYIENFKIDSEELLYELAKIEANKNGNRISNGIKKYGIKDQNKLFEIAQIAMQNLNSDYGRPRVEDYGIEDEEKRFVLAKIVAANSEMFEIKIFNIKNPKYCYQLARLAAAKNGSNVSKQIDEFKLKDENELFEIAKICAAQDGYSTSEHIKKYGIQDPQKLFDIAKIAISQNGSSLEYLENYGIKDKDRLYELARIFASNRRYTTCRHIKKFEVNDINKLFEIAKIAAMNEGTLGIQYFNFTREQNFELAKISALYGPEGTSCYIKDYKLNDEERFMVAKIAAFQKPSSAVRYIDNYQLKEKEKEEIAIIYLNQCLDSLPDSENSYIPEQICGISIEKINLLGLGFDLLRNPNRLLSIQEKEVLGTLSKLEVVLTGREDKIVEEKIILKQTLIHKWLGYYLLKYKFWLTIRKKTDPSHSLTFSSTTESKPIENERKEKVEKSKKRKLDKVEKLDFYPLLKAISKLHNPPMRYKLTQLLFKQLHYAETNEPLKIYQELGKENPKIKSSKRLGGTDYAILRLLFTALICQKDKDFAADNNFNFKEWEEVFSILSDSKYKEIEIQMPIINSIYTLIETPHLTPQEKIQIVKAIFSKALNYIDSNQRASFIIKEFRFLEVILSFKKCEELKKMLLQMLTLKIPFSSLDEIVKSIFKEVIGEIEIENFSEKYEKTVLAGRKPIAFLTYATKLSNMPNILPYLRNFFISILEGKDRENRYKTVPNDHLDTVFSWKTNPAERIEWENIWKRGCSKPLGITNNKVVQDEKELDIQKVFVEKICSDKHLDVRDYPIIAKYLQNPLELGIEGSLKKLNEISESCIKENKKDAKSKILKLNLEKELITLCDAALSKEEKENALRNAIVKMQEIYPNENNHVFLADLKAIEKMINAKERSGYTGWTVEDSDHWEDLLLCGTEVLGSCQNINGNPDYNKCLMNYILDGKNRVVILKDEKGCIQARVILRLLWDSNLKKPVLFRERLYHNAGINEKYISEVDVMCLNKAKAMGIPLTKTKGYDSEVSYNNSIESLNGRAPYEYVDATRGVTSGTFSIGASSIALIS